MTDPAAKINRTQPRPAELYGEECTRDGCTAFVYIGNGAASQAYESAFARDGIDGTAYEGVGGKADLCAIQYTASGQPMPALINAFTHAEATFAGFIVRRKRDGIWEWYCEDGRWYSAVPQMPEKVYYQSGSVPDLTWDGAAVLVFEAKWRDRRGNIVDCGYKIFRNRLMGHSFAGMKGKNYHNTMAAYRRGILRGYKFFEVDLSMTVDGRMVLCHGWSESNCTHIGFPYTPGMEENMTYEKVMRMKVHGNPIIDARQFYRHVKRARKFCYEIDFHSCSEAEIQPRLQAMLEDFNYDEEVLDRLLIQIYNRPMFRGAYKVWHFKHYMYVTGKVINNLDNQINFMVDEGVCGAVIREYLTKPDCVKKLRNAGIHVMAATVGRDTVAAQKLFDSGVNTICTDYLTERKMKKNQDRMGHHPYYIYYNSGSAEAKQDYEALGYGKEHIYNTKVGSQEFWDPEIWQNDGRRQLTECRFSIPGREFLGWNLRMKTNDRWLWYCQDGFYHTPPEFGRTPTTVPRLYRDKETMPVLTVRKNAHLVMQAVWSDPADKKSE